MKLGIIGAGNMASAIIGGIIKKGIIAGNEILCSSPVEAEREKAVNSFGINVTADNKEVVAKSEIILLAVKPQVIPVVAAEIKDDLKDEQLIISIVAGKSIAWYNEAFGRELKIIRTMPNTPALVGEGMTGVSPAPTVSEEETQKALEILSSFGEAEVVPENLMDSVVSVSGSSPAYVFMMIEAMADGAVKLGMPRAKAYKFAAQAVLGSAKMVLETGKHPGELKDMVCSPAGTTIEAVKVLEQEGFRASLIDAMEACADISPKALHEVSADSDAGGPLSLWTDEAEAKKQLLSYMQDITKEGGEDYIPVENRIAVFDLDGTLYGETNPTYFDYSLLLHRVYEDTDYRDKASDTERETAGKILDALQGSPSAEGIEVDHGKGIASSFEGMTVDEFEAYVEDFKKQPAPGYEGMTRGESFYKPMLEVIDLLQANDFTVYIVSGTDRLIVRGIVNGTLDLPMSQVIGSDETIVASGQSITDGLDYTFKDDDKLVLGGDFLVKNLKMNKVAVISQEIGEQPVLSFGNSSGDSSMAEYVTSSNPYKSLAFMLCCDDTEREYGSKEKADKMYSLCEEQGWSPISMKNDWTTIYGDGVKKTSDKIPIPFTKYEKTESVDNTLKDSIGPASKDGYTLEQVVCLSRHNIRSPLSSKGSALDTLTPHDWFEWSSDPSQLSMRGGTLETEMGQYFRKWLEGEGLFEENYQPEDGAVRIYANSKQRTIATAQFFEAGLLPACNMDVEYHADFDTMDPVFNPQLTYASDAYKKAAEAEIRELFTSDIEELSDNYELLSDVIDLEESDDYKSGKFSGFETDDSEFILEEGSEPGVSGSLKTACTVSDALVLQYYEEADEKKAAFGHSLSYEDWKTISEIKDVYGDVLFSAPKVAVNVANPLLKEMKSELETNGRKFTFLCGHDSNISSVLAALNAEDYSLPKTIEKTPIGSKIVISKWKNTSDEEFISFDFVYQTTDQLRNLSLIDENNPPGIYSIRLKDFKADPNGLYKSEDVIQLFEDKINEYDQLIDE